MRPTFSIIFFTVMSGAGYGLWFLFGLAYVLLLPVDGPRALLSLDTMGLGLGFVFVSTGLLSSLGHLGQPQRAWRALSQWRSSWLSREGVAAIATYAPALILFALGFGAPTHAEKWFGALLASGALATVYCTANIYASLKPIRAWHDPHVVPGYLLLSLYSGSLVFWAVSAVVPEGSFVIVSVLMPFIVIATAVAGALLKWLYWHAIDRMPRVLAADATGLYRQGSVRSFEQPHTEENYLTHEMRFVLARKHSRKLRAITMGVGFVSPVLLALLALSMPPLRIPMAWLALTLGMTGIFVERWLFFAEAKHAVMAYYQR